MGCTHEIRQGGVTTVINAGGFAGGCSLCREEAARQELEEARRHIDALCDVVVWMSGSADFSPDGQAGRAWKEKGYPALRDAMNFLGRRTTTP